MKVRALISVAMIDPETACQGSDRPPRKKSFTVDCLPAQAVADDRGQRQIGEDDPPVPNLERLVNLLPSATGHSTSPGPATSILDGKINRGK